MKMTENNMNARAFLEEKEITSETIEQICCIINSVSFSHNRGKRPATIEGKIAQTRHKYMQDFLEEYNLESGGI